jgi:two-component system sensor histidine kinase BaeS
VKLKLLHKLFIAIFSGTAVVLVVVMMLTRGSIGQGFVDYLQQQDQSRLRQLAPQLSNWYREHGDWSVLASDPRQLRSLIFSTLSTDEVRAGRGSGRPGGGANLPGAGARFGAPPTGNGRGNSLPQRLFLLDARHQTILGTPPGALVEEALVPITLDATTIGWLGLSVPRSVELPEEEAFVGMLRRSLLVGIALGLFMAGLLGWLMARHLSSPIQAVAGAIHGLAAGRFGKELSVRGSDEIAYLARDVNRLSLALRENETVRNRWMSDISHELRTPLSIISGELEAMMDGVRPIGPAQLESLREEVLHLNGLIEDLRSLALTDSGALAYRMTSVDFVGICRSVADAFGHRASEKGLSLRFEAEPSRCPMQGDETRLKQLLHNLLENSIRYTDPGSAITLQLECRDETAILRVSDGPPGVSEAQCEQLFERLYRLDSSRGRHSGGSGLGLAICRNIAQAHGGSIGAMPGPEGGLLVTLTLPIRS